MRVVNVFIENFRAIKRLELTDLPDGIVIAGPNGSGKSSVFDALRLLKSSYGQYQENEWQAWFQEFQVDAQRSDRDAPRVLRDPSRPLVIQADIALTDTERFYLRRNGSAHVAGVTWNRVVRQAYGAPGNYPSGFPGGHPSAPGRSRFLLSPGENRKLRPLVDSEVRERMQELEQDLSLPLLRGQLTMAPNGEVEVAVSPVLEIIFGLFLPAHIGVIDYHSPNRTYSREQVAAVNLTVSEPDQRARQSALYNTAQKYGGVKAEMASVFVKELLAERAGVTLAEGADLLPSLRELFEVFFPGKRFEGPVPTREGALRFPVHLTDGPTHDLDDLSSGEKEVLLGYLRLRTSAPRNSVILLDEPELHLNPRLIRGLPRFYQKHVGEALGNQLWMVTHSDALLREAVDTPGFAVYHMEPAAAIRGGSQAVRVAGNEEMERTVMDLVGDLATYSPNADVVLVEGGGESEVDVGIITSLFPEFAERVNLISGGRKQRVRDLHDVLERAAQAGALRSRVFSVVDRDFDGPAPAGSERRLVWDAYHIENYLLEPADVRAAVADLRLGGDTFPEPVIDDMLRSAARKTVDDVVRIRLQREVNRALVGCVQLGTDPTDSDVAAALRAAAERSAERTRRVLDDTLSADALARREAEYRADLERALTDGSWRQEFQGREVLKRFADDLRLGVKYETLRNLIVNTMRRRGFEPAGMRTVIDQILTPEPPAAEAPARAA